MLFRAKIKLAALCMTTVFLLAGGAMGGYVAAFGAPASPPPPGLPGAPEPAVQLPTLPPAAPVAGAAEAPNVMPDPLGPVSIGVITNLTPAQVATLPSLLRTKVEREVRDQPDFRAMPPDFRAQLARAWKQMISVKVLDAGSGTVIPVWCACIFTCMTRMHRGR